MHQVEAAVDVFEFQMVRDEVIDIDLADSPEPEFVGTDEIVFDDPVESPADLDVSMAPDQDIEL